MTLADIAHQRLHTQRIAGTPFATPEEVVQGLGAVQAQDYPAAQWALGLRLPGSTRDTDIERAFTAGTILRTHIMRPTWHFVTPADIRPLLALTAPRVRALNASYYRKMELDDAILTRSNALIAEALQGGKQLTRGELGALLEAGGIATQDNLRLSYLMMQAELDGVICSGARRGKQFTYALLDERAPAAALPERDEMLASWTRRYFTSHGPARLKDYTWWSGLSTADAQRGIAMVEGHLIREVIADQTYWRAEAPPFGADPAPTTYLLPNYDEYTVGYSDHSAIFDPAHTPLIAPRGSIYFGHVIVMDGQIVGAWKRTLHKGAVHLSAQTIAPFTATQQQAYASAAERYGAFLGLPVVLEGP